MKRLSLVAALLMALSLVVSAPVHGQSPAPVPVRLRAERINAAPCPQPGVPICSAFWSGYAYGITTPAQPLATQVAGHWTIPATPIQVPPGNTNGKLRVWIGLGGALTEDPYMIQIGTEAFVASGSSPSYTVLD